MGTDIINDYYEFLLMLALADECGRRGMCLDATNMKIRDLSMLSKETDVKYAYYLRKKGILLDNGNVSEEDVKVPEVFQINLDDITALGMNIFKVENDCYYWDLEYAFSNYPNVIGEMNTNKLVGRKKLNISLLHFLAYIMVSVYLNEIEKKKTCFYFTGTDVCCYYMFLALYMVKNSLPILNYVDLCLGDSFEKIAGDLDYFIYYDKSIHAGKNKSLRTVDEKLFELKKMGLVEGSIAVLYERGHMNESNPRGRITSASIVRIDSCVEGYSNSGINFTVLPVDRTIEEIEYEISTVDEKYLYMFKDTIANKYQGKGVKRFYSFYNIAVGEYIYDESFILLPLEHDGVTTKKVSSNGQVVDMKMDTVNAVYWILCQRFSSYFDKDLYKNMYNGGEPLLYDILNK